MASPSPPALVPGRGVPGPVRRARQRCGARRGRGSDRVARPPSAGAPGCRRTVGAPGVPCRRVTDSGGPGHLGAPIDAGRLGLHCRRVRSLDAARRLDLLLDAFDDLGLLAGHLDSLLADGVTGDRDRRGDARTQAFGEGLGSLPPPAGVPVPRARPLYWRRSLGRDPPKVSHPGAEPAAGLLRKRATDFFLGPGGEGGRRPQER